MPLWAAVVIFVFFLALAIVGIVLIINSVMKTSTIQQFANSFTEAAAHFKTLI